jgi:two-component system heavy metal sensor histidine kinase CusS
MQRIKIDNNSYNDFIVQIALDVTRDHQIISQYRVNLTWMLLIGLFLSVVLSKFVTSQGIKPIKELTTAMQSINVSNLNQRIRAKRWPEELVQPADAFNKMLERIESAFQRLNGFSSNMAHELRTPINNLMGETEIALSSNRTVEEYQEVLSSNLEEYHKLSSVIDRLLFLARADNLRVDLQMKSFDVSQELESIIESYEHVAAEQKIKITYDGNAILTADPILFKRAVANIISNALKYTQEMGSIHISVDGENNKDFFVITISDTGVGISDKCIGFLFDRFYRVDSARNQTSVPGTGLGLSIVKSIMELHGGEINITSEVGIGTTVKLFFPKN